MSEPKYMHHSKNIEIEIFMHDFFKTIILLIQADILIWNVNVRKFLIVCKKLCYCLKFQLALWKCRNSTEQKYPRWCRWLLSYFKKTFSKCVCRKNSVQFAFEVVCTPMLIKILILNMLINENIVHKFQYQLFQE